MCIRDSLKLIFDFIETFKFKSSILEAIIKGIVLLLITLTTFFFQYTFPTLILLCILSIYINANNKKFNKKYAFLLFFSTISPLMISLSEYTMTIYQVNNIVNQQEKVKLVAEQIYMHTLPPGCFPIIGELFRANDWLKYYFIGVGACEEMTFIEKHILEKAGLQCRIVNFPGEDHVFIEVLINNTWMVSDPGYKDFHLTTRKERAKARLKEFGAISYVYTVDDGGFIELTDKYVPTDTIIIKVLKNNEPIANAQVTLKHQFKNHEQSLPTLYTNTQGEVIIKLGALNYNQKAQPAENYYWIYVDGRNTGIKVTSNGIGETHYIKIDL